MDYTDFDNFNSPNDGVELSDTLNDFRKKTNGIIKKIDDPNSVNLNKLQELAGKKLIGNTGASAGDCSEVDIVDESGGISNNDNDTSIPTSAAVKDYVDAGRHQNITVQHDGTTATFIKGCTISRTSAGQYTITVPDLGNLPTAAASLACDWSVQAPSNSTLNGQLNISARTIDNTTIVVETVSLSSYGASGGGNDANTVSFISRSNVDAPFHVIIDNNG